MFAPKEKITQRKQLGFSPFPFSLFIISPSFLLLTCLVGIRVEAGGVGVVGEVGGVGKVGEVGEVGAPSLPPEILECPSPESHYA